MSEERGQFTFWRSIFDSIEALPKKDRLPLFEAVCAYSLDGIEPKQLSAVQNALFMSYKPTLTKGRNKSINGSKGGSKPKANAKQTESSSVSLSNSQQAEKEVEKEKEVEVEKEKEIEVEVEKERKSKANDYARIISTWNAIPGLPHVEKISSGSAREKAVNARIRENGIDKVLQSIEAVKNSDFLLGLKTDWCASFDWLMSPTNFQKVIEGNYRDSAKAKEFIAGAYTSHDEIESAKQALRNRKPNEVPKGASGRLGAAELDAIRQLMEESL